jgi:hypothetical protein
VGCGTGLWLAAFKAAGVADYLGIDGDYVERRLLVIEPERFLGRDLTQPLDVGRRFDLAVCLEVAEHLPPASAGTLVGSLVRLAPVILFSAAIPYQMGEGHVNEQWPEYWRDQFAAHGYVVVDALRDRLWENKDVETWYRQNLLFYGERDRLADYPRLRAELERAGEGRMLSRVHPEHYATLLESFSKQLAETQRLWIKAALPLRELNLIVFPDWRRAEGVIIDQLRTLLAAAFAHPDHARLCIVIVLAADDSGPGARLIDGVYRAVTGAPGTPPGAHAVCVVGGPRFSGADWKVLLGVLQGHVVLPGEDARSAARAKDLPAIPLEAILNSRPLGLQPLT